MLTVANVALGASRESGGLTARDGSTLGGRSDTSRLLRSKPYVPRDDEGDGLHTEIAPSREGKFLDGGAGFVQDSLSLTRNDG